MWSPAARRRSLEENHGDFKAKLELHRKTEELLDVINLSYKPYLKQRVIGVSYRLRDLAGCWFHTKGMIGSDDDTIFLGLVKPETRIKIKTSPTQICAILMGYTLRVI